MKLATAMKVNRLTDVVWEIPKTEKPGMLVPARIYGTEKILRAMDAGVFEQVTNVACLPGIQRYALCMPDGHWGYGFPIGALRHSTLERALFLRGAWAMISIAGCG